MGMTPEEIARLTALSGAADIVQGNQVEPPGVSIFESKEAKGPVPDIYDRPFIGRDDDGRFVPLIFINGELAQLSTEINTDPVVGEHLLATILNPTETFRTGNARAVQAVRRFLELTASGQALTGMEL
jgi:hypothetical protein